MKRATWLAIGAAAAALVAQLGPSLSVLVVAAVACVAFAAIGRFAAPAGIGSALIFIRAALALAVPATVPMATPEQAGTRHEAVVLSINAPAGGLQRAVVELRPPEMPDHVYAWFPRYPSIAPADVLSFECRLESVPSDGSGFAEYLERSGIAYTCRSRDMSRLGADDSPVAALEGLRRWVAHQIATALPEPQAGLATAMAIGLRDLVGREVSDDFRAAGLSHVVAISGWHIALVGAVVGAALAGLSRRQRSLVVLLVIAGYSILAGASPSILRAAVMASVVLLARESGRRGQASAALSLTCAGMLLIDPATIADVGFQLSVVATAGLLLWATPLGGWLRARLPRRTPAWLIEALGVSLAAQAATLPLVLFHFGRLSLVAPLANLLVAPLVAPAMLLTVIALAVGVLIGAGVPAIVFAPLTLIGSAGIGAMVQIAHVSAGLPFATVDVPPPFNLAAAAISAAALLWFSRRRAKPPADAQPTSAHEPSASLRPRRIAAFGVSGLCVLLVLVNGTRPDGRLHVTVLDIGQGDAILLQGPAGGRMLVDTGPDPDRLMTLLDQRIPAWDRRLDVVVLTHPHEDHVGGLALVLDRYRVGEVVESGMLGPGPADEAYRAELAASGRTTRTVAAGDRLWLDGIPLDVDWPLPNSVPRDPPDSGREINDASIVLELHFGVRDMLFTGDAEDDIDPQLLARGLVERLGPQLDVLKVAHHGSRTASTAALIDALSPRIAVISVGWDNDYGHPAPDTLARLVRNGAHMFRTDLDGSIDISTNGTDLLAKVSGGRPHPTSNLQSPDGYPEPHRGSGLAARTSAEREALESLLHRRRGGRVPGRCHGPPRRGRGRVARRGRGGAARSRQGTAHG